MLHPVHQHQLRHQHELIVQLFRQTPSSAWKTHPETGKWSLHEQLAHLARYQQVFLERVAEIAQHDGVSFERYSADADPGFQSFCRKSTPALLESLLQSRTEIITQLSALTEKQLDQKGVHPVFGPMSMNGWTEFFLSHEGHHLFSMFKLSRQRID